jgi:beta-glucanase (GH16 family)
LPTNPHSSRRFRPVVLRLEDRVVPSAPGTGWNLVFSDEFTGTALDTSKWTIGKAWSTADSNREDGLSYIMNDDVIVSNGTLKLRDERRDVVGPISHRVYHYTSGYIQTSGKFSGAYGYFEIRARVPTNVGQGIWPAFWMLGHGWPPEMDIGEWITSGNNFHQGLYGMDSHWHDYHTFTPFPTGFHTYSMLWSPGQEIYYVDGQSKLTINGSYVPSQSMYLILDNGINSTSPPNGSTVFPNHFEVDYVRVYQGGGGGTIVNPGFESGTTGWAFSGSAAVVNYNQNTGFNALRMNGGPGNAQQVIPGLTPNTTYTLSGWDRVSYPSAAARLGVKNYGGAETWADNRSTGYTQESVTFTTGPTSTQATIYCSKPVNGNAAEFDDLDLVTATTASPLPDLTTNIGTPTGTVPFSLTGTAARFAAVGAVSSNPSLVPNQNLHLAGSGTQRTLTVTPPPGQVGTATITLTVTEPIWGGRTTSSFVVNVINSALPSPWWNQDIGVIGYSGSASTDGFTYTVAGSGADIWNQSDGFQYVYLPVMGDGSIIARVTGQDPTGGFAKAGVMIRETLDPGSKHALVDLTPSHGTEFIRRTTTGANAVSNFHTGTAVPYWVRLDRSGDTLTAYDSADGVNWNLVGSATVPMATTVYAGLAVCAFNNGAVNTSTFDNVSLSWTQVPVDLSSSFNQVGSVTDGTPFSGGLDGNGDAYSANLLGSTLSANGYTFNLGAANAPNAVQVASQTISLPAGQFSVLSFLGAGVNGPQPGQTFIVNYTDGSSDTFTQDMSDWLNPQGYAGEAAAAVLSYYDYADGSSPAVTNYLYQYSFALNNQKMIGSISMPNNGNVVILAIDLGTWGNGNTGPVTGVRGASRSTTNAELYPESIALGAPLAKGSAVPANDTGFRGGETLGAHSANGNLAGQTDVSKPATVPYGRRGSAWTPRGRAGALDLVFAQLGSGPTLFGQEGEE